MTAAADASDVPTRTSTRPTARARRRSGSADISRVPYLPGLDGMRALAVAAVMVYHANPDWLPGGYLGVEVFFVISGYLITLLLISEKERTSTVDMKQFWFRRARRLLPALFTMLIALTIWTSLFERRRARQAPWRRDRRAAVRLELVPDLDGRRLHRGQRVRPAASPVEPRRRGAVLRGVAARDVRPAPRRVAAHRRHQPLARARRARHHHRDRSRLHVGSDRNAGGHPGRLLVGVRSRDLEVRLVLPRHVQPCCGPPARRRIRHGVASGRGHAWAAAHQGATPRSRRADRVSWHLPPWPG